MQRELAYIATGHSRGLTKKQITWKNAPFVRVVFINSQTEKREMSIARLKTTIAAIIANDAKSPMLVQRRCEATLGSYMIRNRKCVVVAHFAGKILIEGN